MKIQNLKFKEENENLKFQVNYLNTKISSIENEVLAQKEKIEQSTIDQEELEFFKIKSTL